MQFVGLDFDERQVGLGVSADDAALKFAVVVKFHEQFVGIFHHVVVSYDVAVGREYHARAGTLPLRSLDLALLLAAAAVSEEVAEEIFKRVNILDGLRFAVGGDLYVHNGIDGIFGCIRQVNRLGN